MTTQIADSISQNSRIDSIRTETSTSISNKRVALGKNDAPGTNVTLSESSYSVRNRDELPAWTREVAGRYDAMLRDDAMESLELYATADSRGPLIDITRINEGIITYTHTGELVTPESKERYNNIGKNLTEEFTSIFKAEKDKNTSPGDIFLKFQEVMVQQPDDYLNNTKFHRQHYNPFA
ncbi:hypothetical protein [Kushneria sp. EE4]